MTALPDLAGQLLEPLTAIEESIAERVTAPVGDADRAIWGLEAYNVQYRLEHEHLAHYEPRPEWRDYLAARRAAPPPAPKPDLPWMRNSLARPHA